MKKICLGIISVVSALTFVTSASAATPNVPSTPNSFEVSAKKIQNGKMDFYLVDGEFGEYVKWLKIKKGSDLTVSMSDVTGKKKWNFKVEIYNKKTGKTEACTLSSSNFDSDSCTIEGLREGEYTLSFKNKNGATMSGLLRFHFDGEFGGIVR